MLTGQTILITGGTGSWGVELTKQMLQRDKPKEIRIYSRGELQQVKMKQQFSAEFAAGVLKFIIGDVRDRDRLVEAGRGVDIIFHLAALKHVPVCEENPQEAVKTNILGTQNVIYSAEENNVRKMILISTDKAVDPFNLYGVTKACAEKLVIAANNNTKNTSFFCVRAGNVVGTSGSVFPLFREQLVKGNMVTITEPSMTRFLLRLPQAISLVFLAVSKAVGGEIMVLKMPAVTVQQIADVMIARLGNEHSKIKTIGIRSGEKVHEVLVSRYEASRAIDGGNYFIILPSIHIDIIARTYHSFEPGLSEEYASNNTNQLSNEELEHLLVEDGWFSANRQTGMEELTIDKIRNYQELEGWK